MSDFDNLCKQLEEMDPETFTQIFNKKSEEVLNALIDITADGKDGVTAYMQFILASVAADGKLSEGEFDLLKPMFDMSAKKDVSYEEGLAIFKEMGFDKPETFKDIVDTMVDISLWIPAETIERPFDTFLSNSFGFGGTNSSLVIRNV